MKKILIVQKAFLGDVILTIPLIEVLSKKYEVHFLGRKRAKEFLSIHPCVKKYITFEDHNLFSLIKEIRKENYEIAISPHRSTNTGIILFFSGIKRKIGFNKGGARFFLTQKIPYKYGIHEIERNLLLAEKVAILDREFNFYIPYKEEKLIYWKERIGENFILFSPFSKWKTKMWPEEYWNKLSNMLNERIVIVGEKRILKNAKGINLSGETDIFDLIAIVKLSKLVVSVDTSIVHIASAFKKKIVEIFGPTVKDFGFYPYKTKYEIAEVENLPCRPCSPHGPKKCPLKHHKCMKDLKPEFVLKKIEKLL